MSQENKEPVTETVDEAALTFEIPLQRDDGRALDHPRPQLRRPDWTALDGPWRFTFDDDARFRERLPGEADWTHTILVPFAPESEKSGIGDTGFHQGCWYEREVEIAPPDHGGRVILHFGAVDYEARVWVNGELVGSHRGGHTPFCFISHLSAISRYLMR